MKLFVWDFHGVLEKYNELASMEVTNRVLEEFDKSNRLDEATNKELYGEKWINYFRRLSLGSDKEEIEAMTTRAFQISRTEKPYLEHIKPMDYAKEVLSEIREKGGINVVLSNTSQIGIVNFTNSVGLTDLFYEHIGVDNHLEKEVGSRSKIEALKDYITAKEIEKIVVIGDRLEDIQAGKEVNAVTYLFSRTGDFPEVKADHKISDLREVLKEL